MKPVLFGPLCALLLGSIGSLTYGAGLVLGQTTWMAGNGHTYVIVQFPEETWTTAAADITSTLPGFHLATITSQAEQDFVWNFVVQTTGGGWEWWLGGFQDLQNETDPAAGWMWVTGEPWDYTNWWSSEPNNAGGIEDHLALSGGLWNDEGTAISAIRGYVAEKSNSPILDIEKLTNGSQADGANWPDVPRINAGSAVNWTYVVTNNDELGHSEAEIRVTDSQPGVGPTLVVSSDDGDMILSPGETWIYTAVAETLGLSSPPRALPLCRAAVMGVIPIRTWGRSRLWMVGSSTKTSATTAISGCCESISARKRRALIAGPSRVARMWPLRSRLPIAE